MILDAKQSDDIDNCRAALARAMPDVLVNAPLEFGGQGMVFHAYHQVSRRELAVKIMRGGEYSSPDRARRFQREIEVICSLHHPNIVATCECGVCAHGLWYSMPFIEGIDIVGHCEITQLSPRQCVDLFVEICDALSYAHRCGVIHRDVKPQNILVEGDKPIVLDFGLAQIESDDSRAGRLTIDGGMIGTLDYMSPEQVSGNISLIDVRTDIYSLGVVMYETLSRGELPYPFDGDRESMRRDIVETEPESLRAVSPGLGSDLSSIVHKCLEKRRDDRYDSMIALRDDLGRWLAGDAVQARSDNRWYRVRKTIRKRRWAIAIAASFVLLLAAGLIGTTLMWHKAERATQLARAELKAGGLITLGSAERDSGRIEDALAMWRQAASFCEPFSAESDAIATLEFKALQRLAELEYNENLPDDARLHSAQAIAIAESLFKRNPTDDKLARLLGGSYKLRGKMAFAAKDWEDAERNYRRSLAIREELAREHSGEASLRVEVANIYAALGRTCRRLGRATETYECYQHEYEAYKKLTVEYPAVADYRLWLAFACTHLSSWHINQKSAGAGAEASRYLREAEDQVSAALANDASRTWDAERIRSAVSQHSSILAGRRKGS